MEIDYRINCCPADLVSDGSRKTKVLDCTIRDGGICNDWTFEPDFVKHVYSALAESGVDYMEIGYQTKEGIFDRSTIGPWRFCDEDVLRQVSEKGPMKVSTMVDIGRIDCSDIRPADDSVVDVIRIATYAHQLDEALRILDHCKDNGYETFMNVMAISTLSPEQVTEFLKRLAQSCVDNVAIVDSFGALYPHHIRYLVKQYRSILGPKIGLGVHCHNNQQQAFANSIAAVDEGVDFVDATIFGMGRGAGNCPLELLLFYLDNPKYAVEPVLELTEHFVKLRFELLWGYQMPYAITGYYNLHPRTGIDRMNTEDKFDAIGMYEKLRGRIRKSS